MIDLLAEKLRLSFVQPDGSDQRVLDIDEIRIDSGSRIGLTGSSGAGKTTLIYALTGIQPLDGGKVCWGEVELTSLGESARDRWRRNNIGIVFQDFHLFPGLSILQNVLIQTTFGGNDATAHRHRAHELLARVGAPHHKRSVETLSRGERQRIGIARALLMRPAVLIADEPTANLDLENAREVASMLVEISEESGATLLIISHDRLILDHMGATYRLDKGVLTKEGLR